MSLTLCFGFNVFSASAAPNLCWYPHICLDIMSVSCDQRMSYLGILEVGNSGCKVLSEHNLMGTCYLGPNTLLHILESTHLHKYSWIQMGIFLSCTICTTQRGLILSTLTLWQITYPYRFFVSILSSEKKRYKEGVCYKTRKLLNNSCSKGVWYKTIVLQRYVHGTKGTLGLYCMFLSIAIYSLYCTMFFRPVYSFMFRNIKHNKIFLIPFSMAHVFFVKR